MEQDITTLYTKWKKKEATLRVLAKESGIPLATLWRRLKGMEKKEVERPEPEVRRPSREASAERIEEILAQISILKETLHQLNSQIKTLSDERIKSIVEPLIKESTAQLEERIKRQHIETQPRPESAFTSQLKKTIEEIGIRRRFCAYYLESDKCNLWKLKTGEPSPTSVLECALCNTFQLKSDLEWRSRIDRLYGSLSSVATLLDSFRRVSCPNCKHEFLAPMFIAGFNCVMCGHHLTWATLQKKEG